MRAALKPGEAFLSFYFGRRSSFVWAVPRQGRWRSRSCKAAPAFETRSTKLREALDPQAAIVSEIPAFDLDLAHELYNELLKPVEAGWKGAKDLIVVTNGALGAAAARRAADRAADARRDGEPMFAGYRKVAWLARTHAVTMVPSAAALRTLRGLQPARRSAR